VKNLDYSAMCAAQQVLASARKTLKRDEIENFATKGLGVVLEQGIYAGLLYFQDKKHKEKCNVFADRLLTLTCEFFPAQNDLSKDKLQRLGYLADRVCGSLENTIFVKTMWELTLTYIRYGAKSLPDDPPQPRDEPPAGQGSRQ
jgi:hypothetical protein